MNNQDAEIAVPEADLVVPPQPAVAETAPAPVSSDARPAKVLPMALEATDYVLAVISGLSVVLVHAIHDALTAPYWLDEAWVADSVRAPLGLVPRLASSTPLGWTLLLRLVPFGGPERLRLVPLAFAALAVSAAYLLGRELRLTRFTAGLLTAAAALLSPAMLVREDVKQYTAEAFCSILLWLLVARSENSWTRRRLAAIAATAAIGPLIAETAIITGGVALACLGLAAIIRRQWQRLREIAIAAACTLAVYAVVFVTVVKPRMDPALSKFWAPYYAPASVTGAASFFRVRLHILAPYIGFPAAKAPSHGPDTLGMTAIGMTTGGSLRLALLAAFAGIVALVVLRRFALAAMLPVTLIAVMGASAERIYPFGDARTSTFWIVLFPILGAIGVAAVSHGIGRLPGLISRRIGLPGSGVPRGRPDRLAGLATRWAVPVVCAVLAVGYYARAVRPEIKIHDIISEDARSQVQFAEAHQQPGDVCVVDFGASYAYAYYSTTPATAYPPVDGIAASFVPQYPGDPHTIVITNQDASAEVAAMRKATAIIAAEPPGKQGRIWVIREHDHHDQLVAWQTIFNGLNKGGGHVTIYDLSKLGYQPGYQAIAMYTPPKEPVSSVASTPGKPVG